MKNIKFTPKATLLTLAFFVLSMFSSLYSPPATADILSSYQILKQDYADVLDGIIKGGATEAEVEAMLIDLETNVNSQAALTMDNFNSIMYQSFQEVIQWRIHRNVFRALLISYGDEINYTLANGELHPSLIPIRDAVMESLLGTVEEPPEDETPPVNEKETSKKELSVQTVEPIITSPTPVTSNFTDIKGHWAEDHINDAWQKGLVSGLNPYQFAPDRQITRAEFAALILQANGQQYGQYTTSQFYDVPTNAWYNNVVNKSVELGIMAGYSSTQFGPQDPITREQMAVIISRTLQLQNSGSKLIDNETDLVLAAFADQSSISAWAREGVALALVNEIVTGRTAAQFAPASSATRAEAAVMILKMHSMLN